MGRLWLIGIFCPPLMLAAFTGCWYLGQIKPSILGIPLGALATTGCLYLFFTVLLGGVNQAEKIGAFVLGTLITASVLGLIVFLGRDSDSCREIYPQQSRTWTNEDYISNCHEYFDEKGRYKPADKHEISSLDLKRMIFILLSLNRIQGDEERLKAFAEVFREYLGRYGEMEWSDAREKVQSVFKAWSEHITKEDSGAFGGLNVQPRTLLPNHFL